jgi:energy-coupling factor transporter ATP-binding protein EcfA2
MPLLTLLDAQLAYGDFPLLDRAAFSLDPGERIGPIGRNGTGKSSLLSVIAGTATLDDGELRKSEGTRIAFVEQEPKLPHAPTLRASLLLLDEPTNHLDIAGIEQLETVLLRQQAAIVLTHDRAFLDRVCTRILELDRGMLRSFPGNYSAYEIFAIRPLAYRSCSCSHDRLWRPLRHTRPNYARTTCKSQHGREGISYPLPVCQRSMARTITSGRTLSASSIAPMQFVAFPTASIRGFSPLIRRSSPPLARCGCRRRAEPVSGPPYPESDFPYASEGNSSFPSELGSRKSLSL